MAERMAAAAAERQRYCNLLVTLMNLKFVRVCLTM